MTQIEWIKIACHCTRCKKPLVLQQDPECPELVIKKWLPLIVCQRCGEYLEAYRRIDDATAYVCSQWVLVMNNGNAGEVASALRDKLIKLTQNAERLFNRRWNTLGTWCMDWVDLLMAKPEACRMAMRSQEKAHIWARQQADEPKPEATLKL